MTEEEFVTILGDEWRLGRGKVDWFAYWPGKVSQQSVMILPDRILVRTLT
jgi:regulator of nonsense transcripts 3